MTTLYSLTPLIPEVRVHTWHLGFLNCTMKGKMGLNTWALELSPCSGPHAARSLCNKLIRNSFHAKNSLKNGKKSFSGKWVKNPPKPSRQGQIDRDGFAMLRIICNAKTRPKVKLKAQNVRAMRWSLSGRASTSTRLSLWTPGRRTKSGRTNSKRRQLP